MRNLFKKFDRFGLLAFAAAGVFAISWNTPESSTIASTTGWYSISVNPSDQNNKSSQQIDAFVSSSAPSGNCNVSNPDKPCQVHLDLTNFSSATPIEDMTVQQALNAGASITSGGTASPDGYAREEE
ncbi:hypothetical protein [Sphingobacterium sp. LRF_L2]|uniref:hypothetical protein n=1 Tax=Sphingobacterium sp. LRF_L2 TaxID=3369421 RepID=UPI003F61BF3F